MQRNCDTASRIRMSVKNRQLTINNTRYRPEVPVLDLGECINIDPDEMHIVQEKQLVALKEYRERGNVYYAYAYVTNSIPEVRSIYKHLRMKHHDATHIMMAHNIAGLQPELKDYADNGEVGSGNRLLSKLIDGKFVDTAAFVVRYCGNNLGVQRFEIINELMDQVLPMVTENCNYLASKLKPKHHQMKMVNRRTRGRITGSRGGMVAGRGKPVPMYGGGGRFASLAASTTNTQIESESKSEVVIQAKHRMLNMGESGPSPSK